MDCPHCKENSISRARLILSYVGVPVGVVYCKHCHAIVSITEAKNPILQALLYITWLITAVLLAFSSLSLFGNFWLGIVLTLVLYLGRAYLKSREKLTYIR